MITGTAAGVPFVAAPPERGEGSAPVVVGWHLVDAPRTEAAFAAAVPLAGLDAWRIYFGLPLTGSRLPEGGPEELRRRVQEDAVLGVHQHIAGGGADEFPAAFAAVRKQLGIDEGPIGVLGASMGGALAQLVTLESGADVRAAVLINPVVRMRDTIDALSAHHGMTYTWTPPSDAFAARTDFVARAAEFAGTAVLAISGEDDLRAAFLEPVAALVPELRRHGVTADWRTIPGMGHALADEPGIEPAPQRPTAAEVDRLAVAWFAEHLLG
jgi:pimeloyl-ACP methyl ester carboxylesterase